MHQIFRYIIAFLLLALGFLFLAAVGELLFIKQGLGFFQTLIQKNFLIPNSFVLPIAIVLTVTFFVWVLPQIKHILNPTIGKRKKNTGLIIGGGFFALLYVAVAFANMNSNFDGQGKAITCYTEYAGKRYESNCTDKLDRRFNTPVIKTSTKSLEMESFTKVTGHEETIFFNPSTGKPMLSYGRGLKGQIELFNVQEAIHPQTGQKLLPITPNVVIEYLNQEEEQDKVDREQTIVEKEAASYQNKQIKEKSEYVSPQLGQTRRSSN